MTPSRRDHSANASKLTRMLARKRRVARVVLLAEQALPRLMAPLCIVLLFLSSAWFGLFRSLPAMAHLAVALAFAVAFLVLLFPLARLRFPTITDADRMLEQRNDLPHQAIGVQEDTPATEGAFGRALWLEHQARMARQIDRLDAGTPKPDIARFDIFGLRAVPVLLVCVAFAYSTSNSAGLVSDVYRLPVDGLVKPDIRIDAWITPPAYTGRAPIFLTGRDGASPTTGPVSIPQFSDVTVRVTAGTKTPPVTFLEEGAAEPIVIPVAKTPGGQANTEALPGTTTSIPAAGSDAHLFKVARNGSLSVDHQSWAFTVVPDAAPEIAFDGTPRATVNAALEISYRAKDDYGVTQAWADIEPADAPPENARPLYPLPEYRLDLPRRNARDAKGLTSRNLSEHPLAGKHVRITLIAKDASGQEGRSAPQDMILPAKRFSEPLAGAVAEQRQVFALNANDLQRSIDLNDALMVRADETIPNLTHFLLLKSARSRMVLARGDDALRQTADYLWEIALGIEDGDLSLADKQLRDAQQKLSEALERGASDAEISKLMQDLREAMQKYMEAIARQAAKNPQTSGAQNQNKVIRQQDLQKMMDQIENLAKSGAKDQARQMLSEMQRMMNNLQAGRPQQKPGQGQDNSEMREQMDKLGKLMQEQQKLMEQTFQYDQAQRDRMQRGDQQDGDQQGGDQSDELFDQPMPPEPGRRDSGKQQGQSSENPLDKMTAEDLENALKKLKEQQDALGKQLGDVQKGMEGLGIKPGKGFGEAGREMKGAAGQLGEGQGEEAVGSQGRALQALRQGVQDMMQQMQGQGPGQGQGIPRYGQNGNDPLGRSQGTPVPDFSEGTVPDEIDTQRAREILEEIRRKLGTNTSPATEKQYLERLLDLQ